MDTNPKHYYTVPDSSIEGCHPCIFYKNGLCDKILYYSHFICDFDEESNDCVSGRFTYRLKKQEFKFGRGYLVN